MKIPVERDQTENEFRQYAAEFLALKSKYERILDDRKHLEAELETTQQHHNKYKQDLMRVRNEKEYSTALREIDATKKQMSALETEILKCMEEIEKLEAELAVRAPDVEKKRAEVDLSLDSLNREQEEASRQAATLSERREQLSRQLPRQLFATYDRMARLRRGQALAEVRDDGICTACRMRVRPKIFSDVRRGQDLVTCESCGRILYYKPAAPRSVEAAKLD
ncbi:MAG TPA: C4-type zinc ribbon domain-containing protein [Blastocatellia bacterium]|nr:C4-type zinc ribbon domain-containing protein [Blastocatellia bacterium]